MLIYLENQSNKTFWEAEWDEKNEEILTIRQGEIGTAGKSRGLWLEQNQTAEQLADAKRKKGYVDVSPPPPILTSRPDPETLPGEPLSEEQTALFTRALIDHTTEVQYDYWRRQMAKLMREKVYSAPGRLTYIGGARTLAQEYETIAAWNSPAMDREVDRDDRGMVTEIRYYINGLLVLKLENSNTGHEGFPPIKPFFVRVKGTQYGNGFQYGKKKTLVEEARQLLIHYPAFLAEHLPLVQGVESEVNKESKIRTIAQGGISVMVDSLMQGTGHEYRLLEEEKRSILLVALDGECYMELSLPHRTFQQRMGLVLPTVELVKGMYDALPLPVRYTNGASYVDWGEVHRHDYYYHSRGEDPRHDFWHDRNVAYVERKLAQDAPQADRPESIDLEAAAQWDIPGLEQKVHEEGGEPAVLSYFVDGRCILHLYPTTTVFPLGGYITEGLFDEGMPTLPTLRSLLEGLPDFYRKSEEAFSEKFNDAECIETIRRLMAPTGYQWHLNLSRNDKTSLSVKHKKNTYFKLLFPRTDLASTQGILPAIERVDATLKASKLPFKIDTVWRRDGFRKG